MTDAQKEFVKLLKSIDHSKSNRDKFTDFLEIAYCALAQRGLGSSVPPRELEVRYMRTMNKDRYPKLQDRQAFSTLMSIVLAEPQRWEGDFLGPIACDDDVHALSPEMGQFFTPYPVCQMMAEMTLHDTELPAKGYIHIAEPSCGAGAMVIASAKAWERKGHDLTSTFLCHATDLSDVAYKMAFIQLWAYGIPARVDRGNSLSQEVFEWAYTGATRLFYAEHEEAFAPAPKMPAVRVRTRAPKVAAE